jgi:hypothetical protein
VVGHISLLLLLWFGLPSLTRSLGTLWLREDSNSFSPFFKVPERYCFDSFALDMEVILGFKKGFYCQNISSFSLIRPGLTCSVNLKLIIWAKLRF